MLFNVVNYFACMVFVVYLIKLAREYTVPKNFIFWCRVFLFSMVSSGIMNLALTAQSFFFFAGVIVSAFAAYIMSSFSKRTSTFELFSIIFSSMFFWPYVFFYLMFCLTYMDHISDNKE